MFDLSQPMLGIFAIDANLKIFVAIIPQQEF